MMYINQIRYMFGCSESRAEEIFSQMCQAGFDFSESTDREFQLAAREAFSNVLDESDRKAAVRD